MTSVAGMAKASRVVEHHGARVMLFGAIPCTGGSQFWHINKLKGKSAHQKHFAHLKLFRELWDNVVLVAEQVFAARDGLEVASAEAAGDEGVAGDAGDVLLDEGGAAGEIVHPVG